jgi:hypothetical protein
MRKADGRRQKAESELGTDAGKSLAALTEGDTYEEARTRVKEAIEGYLESLQKDGQPIPADKKLTLDPVKEKK